jgi:hypothetical protein
LVWHDQFWTLLSGLEVLLTALQIHHAQKIWSLALDPKLQQVLILSGTRSRAMDWPHATRRRSGGRQRVATRLSATGLCARQEHACACGAP